MQEQKEEQLRGGYGEKPAVITLRMKPELHQSISQTVMRLQANRNQKLSINSFCLVAVEKALTEAAQELEESDDQTRTSN